MLQKQTLFHLVIAFTSFVSFAQKKEIDHTAYNDWKRISESVLSPDGKYTAYTIVPYKGDGFAYLVDNVTGVKDSVARGKGLKFSADSKHLIFKIAPQQEKLHKAELDKQKKDKWPKDSLAIWNIYKDSITKVPNISKFELSEKGTILVYLSNKNLEISSKELVKKSKAMEAYYPTYSSKKSSNKKALYQYLKNLATYPKKATFTSNGYGLTIVDLSSSEKFEFPNVQEFTSEKNGKYISYSEHRQITKYNAKKPEKDSSRVFVFDIQNKKSWFDKTSYSTIKSFAFAENGANLSLLATQDTLAERNWELIEYATANGDKKILVDSSKVFEHGRKLSGNGEPFYANKDKDIVFGVYKEEDIPVKDSLVENEKANVDVWSWKDERIQPEQLVSLKSDEKKNNPYIFHRDNGEIVQLGSDTLRVLFPDQPTFGKLLAFSTQPYRYKNWESPSRSDVYIVDPQNGKTELATKGSISGVWLSPSGKLYTYFNENDQQYYLRNLETKSERCVTCDNRFKFNIMSDLNGMPMLNEPLGIIGWTTNEKGLLIQAEHDILFYNILTNNLAPINRGLTKNDLSSNYSYNLVHLATDSSLIYGQHCILTKFNEKTKAMSVYRIGGDFPNEHYTLMDESDHNYINFRSCNDFEIGGEIPHTIIYQKHSNLDYPELYVSYNSFEGTESIKISNTNPQQKEYNWSTVELINWTSYAGEELEGLLYKPENFDPNKKYPLLVYYYEMYADEMHNHYAPKPTASIIHPTEYASAGYVVLIPDIRYKAGYPAKSAYDCIMSATDAALKKYPNIDSTRMGLQGQSWGGYQTAQLVTMTTRYKAAMAGAPVSNMISAYGGIRWGSGFSRQFQYEHTQSRIGKTIWEAPELYIENSPLFHLPKVQTPLLVMANDEDGAVPWYQGIELYMGLRRLNKPVWMLNYVGDDHNLMKPANRMDLSIRMRQFFDYYLLDKECPVWLKDGIPAVDKGSGIQYDITK